MQSCNNTKATAADSRHCTYGQEPKGNHGACSDISLASPYSQASSFFSSSSSSSSASLSSLASSFLSSAAFASSSSFFLLFSTSLKSFHFFCKSVSFSFVISDDNVVEDAATLDLPKIKP